jgi:hypothetical protein
MLAAVALPPLLLVALIVARHQADPLRSCDFVHPGSSQLRCYSRQMDSMVHREGLQAALTDVDARASHDAALQAQCHMAWHRVSEPVGRADALAHRAPAQFTVHSPCQEGYLHGYWIGYLSSHPLTLANAARLTVQQCARYTTSRSVLNCVHTFGHSFSRASADSPARMVSMCHSVPYDRLVRGTPDSTADQLEYQCYYGGWMEIGLRDVLARASAPDNCGAISGPLDALRACYAYLPQRDSSIAGASSGRVAAQTCERYAPAAHGLRDTCIAVLVENGGSQVRCSWFGADASECERLTAGWGPA